MEMLDNLWLFGVVMGWLAVETIKLIIRSKDTGFTAKDRDVLQTLYGLSQKTDATGRPLVYFPPGIEDRQKRLVEDVRMMSNTLSMIHANQQDTLKILHDTALIQKEITLLLKELQNKAPCQYKKDR